jgi:hypothetical protein
VIQLALDLCQRWRGRRDTYRPAGEPIDPRRYGVEPIEEATAKAFVFEHHYAASYPAARFRAGLFRTRRFASPELVGVAVFSVPVQPAAVRRHAGVEPHEGVELGRFVLLDDVEANGETWFLARAWPLLRAAKPDVRAVLSYSDPVPRAAADGRVVKPGHLGTIYRAFNGRLVGRSAARTLILDRDGRVVSGRALSKIRLDERGADAAIRALVAAGAPQRRPHEDGAAYVERALREGPFRRVAHPGNLAYVWGLDAATRAGLPEAVPYPEAA